jgi:hypothetical protein
VLGPGRRNHPSPTPRPISDRSPCRNRNIAKKCLFFRILTDVQLHMNGSLEIDGRSLRKPCAPASSAPGDATMTLGDLV